MGWVMGVEPTTFGTTIRRSNQLNYTHHMALLFIRINIIIARINVPL